mmetsp:Transcript_22932/g.17381  ORF Transcript_22932/g.17381 Transcript_22932/m.17381 type:complete len:83 (-) Transcript_22932:217-465(-)
MTAELDSVFEASRQAMTYANGEYCSGKNQFQFFNQTGFPNNQAPVQNFQQFCPSKVTEQDFTVIRIEISSKDSASSLLQAGS